MKSIAASLMVVLGSFTLCHADILKCVNAEGKVAFTNLQCPDGFDVEEVSPETQRGPGVPYVSDYAAETRRAKEQSERERVARDAREEAEKQRMMQEQREREAARRQQQMVNEQRRIADELQRQNQLEQQYQWNLDQRRR